MPDSGVSPVKVVSETTRERETFRYEPSLRADSRFNSDGGVFPASEVTTASDPVLTGLAQLGTYQTKTDRAFISLFDSSHQYVIAEAAPSIRITPRLSSDSCPVSLSLCGTAIPRHQGTCEHVLFLPTNSQSASELPISLVKNLAADDRFTSRPYCQFGETGQFYAAVPIRTRRGINIGAYCVMNPTPPEGWDDECTHRLQDISQAVMEHLEFKRSKSAVRGHERMNRGLGSFIEGKSTLWGWQSGPNHDAFVDKAYLEGGLNAKQQLLERQQQDASKEDGRAPWIERLTSQMGVTTLMPNDTSDEGSTATTDTVVIDFLHETDGRRVGYSQPRPRATSDQGDDLYTNVGGASHIFSKAANIIRESFEVEGCVFLDVTLGSYRQPTDHKSPGAGFRDKPNEASSTSSSDEHTNNPTDAPDSCDIIGFATTDASSINGNKLINGNIGTIPKRFLAKLLRRYPNGKIFNFDGYGELQPIDSSEDDSSVVTPSLDAEACSSRACMDSAPSILPEKDPQDGQYSRLREGSLIHQAFLSARSVAFIPVWDPKRERWVAGGFIYTLTPTRVFSVERELSFLTAFARLVAAELVNLEMLQVDRAKSDTLGSLSHELRSPLHGVILGTELLNDTKLTVFQGTTTHMIETSCRTLLDTIDHLLDYSKVSGFITEQKQVPKSQKRTGANQVSKNLSQDIRLDGIIEEVSESVFAGFSFQRMSVRQLSRQYNPTFTDDAAHRRMDFARAVEQFATSPAAEGHRFGNDNIAVYLSIDPLCDWMFRAQPGAVRRIFMNLFGNSLKYSTTGTILVTLTQEAIFSRHPTPRRLVKLTVQDTGRGMSKDFLRHKLFKPFAQEDELMTGTGLGLSLVKKIVTQLGGEIRVQSQVEIGTIVTVTLPLEQSPQTSNMPLEMREDEEQFKKQLRELKGLRVRVSGFKPYGTVDGRAIVEHICRHWLQLQLVSDEERHPDIVIRSEDTLPEPFEEIPGLAKTPNVVICQDALAAYRQLTRYENVGRGGIFEFVSQPIGPRIMAKSLVLAYKKWTGLPKLLAPPRPRGPIRAHSLHTERLITKAPSLETSWEALSTNRSNVSESPPAMSSAGGPSEAHVGPTPCYQTPDAPIPAKVERCATGRMLVVDDNHINLRILAAYLSKLGMEYELATNGEEAINAYTRQAGHFMGILMDISMPIMDGLEATRQIRAHERKHQLDPAAIIALTGLTSDSTHQKALDSGVDKFLTKPVRLKLLGEELKSMGIVYSLPVQGGK